VRFSFLGVVGFSSLALFLDIGDVFAGSSYIRFFFFDPRFLYPRRGLFGLGDATKPRALYVVG